MRDSDRESASRSGESPKRVVVVGGGFAGRRLQKLLLNSNAAVEVTLVDAKGYFEYTPSSLRCLVCKQSVQCMSARTHEECSCMHRVPVQHVWRQPTLDTIQIHFVAHRSSHRSLSALLFPNLRAR